MQYDTSQLGTAEHSLHDWEPPKKRQPVPFEGGLGTRKEEAATVTSFACWKTMDRTQFDFALFGLDEESCHLCQYSEKNPHIADVH